MKTKQNPTNVVTHPSFTTMPVPAQKKYELEYRNDIQDNNAVTLGILVQAFKEIADCDNIQKANDIALNAIDNAMNSFRGLLNSNLIDPVLFVTTVMGVDPTNQ